MRQKNIRILPCEARDRQDIMIFLKSAALEFKDIAFSVQCEEKEYALFSDYPNIHKAATEEETDYDFVFDFQEEDMDRLLPFLDKEKKKYLLLLDEKEEDAVLSTNYLKAERFVAEGTGENPKVSLISKGLEQRLPHDDRISEESIRDLFESKADMVVLTTQDYSFFRQSIDGFLAFCKKKKETSKNLFSSMGSYFFKNYMSRNEEKKVEDCFSFYEILLGKKNTEIHIKRPSGIQAYLGLLRSLVEEKN